MCRQEWGARARTAEDTHRTPRALAQAGAQPDNAISWARVFVTGAVGFIGSAIVQERLGAGHQVLGLGALMYLPRADFNAGSLRPAPGSSFCEWKGDESYLDVVAADAVAGAKAWTYLTPTPEFAWIADHVALYAAAMDACYVDGKRVRPQPGGFYGGWITDDVVGPFKGVAGSMAW